MAQDQRLESRFIPPRNEFREQSAVIVCRAQDTSQMADKRLDSIRHVPASHLILPGSRRRVDLFSASAAGS
jgi:hypothetical protein